MKKVLSSLVVLAILVGMFVCLGAQAFAEEEPPTAIFAVSDAELSVDSIGTMKDKAPDCLIVDVNGLAEGQGATGYSVVWRESDPMIMTDFACIWPGMVQMFYVGPKSELVVLVGVSGMSASADIEAAIADYLPEEPYVIAIGPKDAASVIAGCPNVDMFMTSGLEGEEASAAASAVGAAKLENVGSDEANPVCQVILGEDNAIEVSAIPVPGGSAAADPNLGGPIVTVPDIEPSPEPVTHTITFDAGGAVGTMEPVTVNDGEMWFFPNWEGIFTYEGYNCTGWSLNGDNANHQPGEDVTVTADITVTAQWEPIPVENVTVSYTPGDGGGSPIEESYAPGTEITLQPWPADYTKDGFTMTGWTIGGEHHDVSSAYTIQESVSATAEWTAVPVETVDAVVTFNAGEAAGVEGNGDTTDTVADIGEGVDFGLPTCSFTYEGHSFTGWKAEDGTDTLYTPADGQVVTYHLTGDVTFVAQWQEVPATEEPEPTEEPETTYTITFDPGEGSDTMEPVTLPEGSDYELPACTFTAPENKEFAGWSVNGAAVDPDAKTIPVLGDTVLTATWKDKIVVYTVTYTAGEAAAVEGNTDKTDTCEQGKNITTMICPFKAPEGKTFSHWAIGEATYGESVEVSITADTTITAIWKDAVLPNIDATPQDPNDAKIEWTRGVSKDKPSVTFNDAQIATVSIGTVPLTAGSQVTISGSTLTLEPSYLDTLPEGPYTVSVYFNDAANGAKYNPYPISLAVSIPTEAKPAATLDPNMSWDRSRSDWYHNFGKQITKLEIYYGGDNPWREAKAGTDYYVSGGTTLYLKQAMVNGGSTWGGKWEDVSYTFRVSFSNGDPEEFKVKLSGKDKVVDNVATPVPTNASGVPVTGDETPIVTYIVVLAVLIVALAVVIIIVMKRRRGAGGRH